MYNTKFRKIKKLKNRKFIINSTENFSIKKKYTMSDCQSFDYRYHDGKKYSDGPMLPKTKGLLQGKAWT